MVFFRAMKRDVKTVAGWDFDRIMMSVDLNVSRMHTQPLFFAQDVIETGGKKAWEATYDKYLS